MPPAADRFCVDQVLAQRKRCLQQLRKVNAQLKAFAEGGSGKEQADRGLIKLIPGVGIVASDVVLADFADGERCSSLKKARRMQA